MKMAVFTDIVPCCLVDSIRLSDELTASILMMEAVMSVSMYQTIQSNIPDGSCQDCRLMGPEKFTSNRGGV
jgi:hypothetical protein